MNHQEFNKLCLKLFPGKVEVKALDPRPCTSPQVRQKELYTEEEMQEYGEFAWVLGEDGVIGQHKTRCVHCDAQLAMHFRWGFVHGEGTCSRCKAVDYRLYHRPREGGGYPIIAYAVVGLSRNMVG